MAYAHFDTSPFEVGFDTDRRDGGLRYCTRPYVLMHGERIWESDKWESYYSGPDEDAIKSEWDQKWEAFQVESFKEWLKTNGMA